MRFSQLHTKVSKSESAVLEVNGEQEPTLRFGGTVTFESEVVPYPPSPESLHLFFDSEVNRNLLLAGSGKTLISSHESTPDLMVRWKEEARKAGAAEPNERDRMIRAVTPGIKFPGLTIKSVAILGTKIVQSDASPYPSYQCIMVGDTTEPEGLPPLVWVYNKLTGGQQGIDTTKTQSARSFNSFCVKHNTENLDEFFFESEVMLQVDLNFPPVLLKLIPGDKAIAEEKGTAAIMKTLNDDIPSGIANFREAYIKSLSM
eukprot:scaffold50625_cov46-Attheya_sp.AAC.2